MDVLKTPKGKEIELYHDGFVVRARFKGGGEMPDELKGTWTNKEFAMTSIKTYLDKIKRR